MNIRSTGISDDSSCASLQGCTAACVGLKMTEEQWLQSFVFGQKQTNKKKEYKEYSPLVFSQGLAGEFQSCLSLDCPALSLS